jgi:uncharacterized protein YpuA (DUF1002 family)
MVLRRKTVVLSLLVLLLIVIAVVNHNLGREIAGDNSLTFVKDEVSGEPDVPEPEGDLALDSEDTGNIEIEEAERLAAIVTDIVNETHGSGIPTVEDIQDIVERVLIEEG